MEPNNNLMDHILDSRPPMETISTPAGPLYLIHKDYKLDTTSIHAKLKNNIGQHIFYSLPEWKAALVDVKRLKMIITLDQDEFRAELYSNDPIAELPWGTLTLKISKSKPWSIYESYTNRQRISHENLLAMLASYETFSCLKDDYNDFKPAKWDSPESATTTDTEVEYTKKFIIHAPQSFSLDLPIFHPILNHQFTASIKTILYWFKTKDSLSAEIKQIHPHSIYMNATEALKSDVKAFVEAEISKSTVLLIA